MWLLVGCWDSLAPASHCVTNTANDYLAYLCIMADSVICIVHNANDAKTFLKHLATVYFISALHVRTLGAEIK